MAERVAIGYQRLFEVRLLHHYWLDKGQTLFDAAPEDIRNKYLLAYDVRSFLKVTPTAATALLIKGLRGIFKSTGLGWVIAVPQEARIPDNAVFAFSLTVENADFYNYTALTLSAQKIQELYHPAEHKIYRYKENVPVLSNLTGVARGTGATKALFLSKEFPALPAAGTDHRVESLFLSGPALVQLTSDGPSATTQQLSPQAADVPLFVHQDDVPAIVPPAGLVGAPARGIQLSEDIPDQAFALVHIASVRPGDADYSCTSAGQAKANYPVFHIRFKNRSTFWKYFNKSTGAEVSTESTSLPLTKFGNAGAKRQPLTGSLYVAREAAPPAKITGIFSHVFE